MLSPAARDALESFMRTAYFFRKPALLENLLETPSFHSWLGGIDTDRAVDDIVRQVVSQVDGQSIEADLIEMLRAAFPDRSEEINRIELLAFLLEPDQVFLGKSLRDSLLEVALERGLHTGRRYAEQISAKAGVPKSLLAQCVVRGGTSGYGREMFQRSLLTVLDNQLGSPSGEAAFRGWLAWAIEAVEDERAEALLRSVATRVEALSASALPARETSPETGLRGSALEQELTAFGTIPNLDTWLAKIDKIRRAVCRITAPDLVGTGFLVAPDLVLSNQHVVAGASKAFDLRVEFEVYGEARGVEAALHPNAWNVRDRAPDPSELTTGPCLADPNPEYLDYALLRLAEPYAAAPLPLPRGRVSLIPGAGLVIVQHPEGKGMALAQHPEALLELSNRRTRIRYRVDTRGGASGSPVLALEALELRALHHGAGREDKSPKVYSFNRGIPIDTIVDDLRGGKDPLSDADLRSLGIA